ncbi:hypothetical protein [Schaedlerella sp.]|jgi:hypothetical protein|uniref:hypothetical protein n=1 Tax=Schaedlerella sp. TaxID=2676057 RepID=UPI0013645E4A|nr:hypothetical protein [uncultured Schaedlerella sp.]MCI8769199.1 hypothetical protein [Ruminococcus sp.]NBI99408.1 hypothetical protein [Lachnospiraceae bacterium]
MNINMKDTIDRELECIVLSEEMKSRIRKKAVSRRRDGVLKWAVVFAAAVILGGTGAAAGYRMLITHSVNGEVLPELDPMRVVEIHIPEGQPAAFASAEQPAAPAPAEQPDSAGQGELTGVPDEYGMIQKDYKDYRKIQEELGIHLLDTELSANNPYMQGHIMTDGSDFAMITVENYILGDTGRYQFLEEENRYAYESGNVFLSPISLTVRLILSEEQLNRGWDWEYLGMYRFAESYTSGQGYRVNLVERTLENGDTGNAVLEKSAVFVADGVEYTLRGRVSMETMKGIVETMK